MSKRSPLLTLFFTIFLDMLGVGMLIPVVPLLFTDATSPYYVLPPGVSHAFGYVLLGGLVALYSLGQFFSAPIIGQFSDKIGRKRLLIFSILAGACAHALFAFGLVIRAAPLLFFARLVGGIAAGNIVVAQAAIADVSKPEDRAKNFGIIGGAFGLGFIVGPFLGGRLAESSLVSWFNPTTPFWFAAILALVNAFLVTVYFRETHESPRRLGRIEWGRALTNILHAFSLSKVRPLFVTNFLFQAAFSFYTTFAAVFFFARFGMTEADLGNYFAYVGIWVVIAQVWFTRIAAARWGSAAILRYGLFGTGIMIFIIALLPGPLYLLLTTPFFAAAIGLTNANMTALISRSASAEIQGEVLGVSGSVSALATLFPPLLSGVIVALSSPSISLFIAAFLAIGAGLYFAEHVRRAK